jgi:hypothetical protein
MAVCPYCEQEMTAGVSCTVEQYGDFVDGVERERIRYGFELLPPFCVDCRAPLGELHHPGCDVELCPKCRRQAISCECVKGGE